ncbi:hypothetical protein AFE_1242 [Acidithiobacillus ferrooxidans ATCC 23270]|uniref:Uncharacterized protein n=1 Tax=Acidithiobacillus ferrooxidans (strain ATCC 23270 / DSM 14882 / CIP 104768 / NCIMB 8455) TaxID=243159 RepID=B7J8S3_ACIF2|nr:hypothetical protein AFE_1242 [Acidithiobacillus ferrooxidans ATCC 23270]
MPLIRVVRSPYLVIFQQIQSIPLPQAMRFADPGDASTQNPFGALLPVRVEIRKDSIHIDRYFWFFVHDPCLTRPEACTRSKRAWRRLRASRRRQPSDSIFSASLSIWAPDEPGCPGPDLYAADLLALNVSTLRSGISNSPPVCGLRPMRAAR